MRAELARWIGNAAQRPLASNLSLPALPSTLPELIAAVDHHPVIDGLDKQIETSATDIELARQSYKPDFSVEGYFAYRPGFSDFVGIQFTMDLPYFTKNRQDPELAAAFQRSHSSADRKQDMLRELHAQVDPGPPRLASLQRAGAQFDTTIIPNATQRVEDSLSAYGAGRGTFDAVLVARRSLLDIRQQRLALAVDAARSQVRLQYFATPQIFRKVSRETRVPFSVDRIPDRRAVALGIGWFKHSHNGKSQVSACGGASPTYWYDPMVPNQRFDKPGKSPFMDMQLVPKCGANTRATSDTASPASSNAERKPLYWYDPMVPQQHFDKPGKSPTMSMPLVAKYADDATGSGNAPAGTIAIDPRVVQNLGVRLGPVVRGSFARAVDTVGVVAVDEHRIEAIQVRQPGWVERLDVRAVGDSVRRDSGSPVSTPRTCWLRSRNG